MGRERPKWVEAVERAVAGASSPLALTQLVEALRGIAERYVQVEREARFWGLIGPEESNQLDLDMALELEAVLDEGLQGLRRAIALGQADVWRAAYGRG